MKKLFAILLGLVLVLGLSSMALAATESFTGSVEVKWSDGDLDTDPGAVFGGSKGAVISVDYAKDFSETVSAGLKVKIDVNDHNDWRLDPDATDGLIFPVVIDDDGSEVDPLGYVTFDGAGWIKVKSDLADFTAWTAIKGAAGKDITTGDISENPGVQVDLKAIEGLSATLILNNEASGTDALYNFAAKGSYTLDVLTVGGGYSSDALDANDSVTAFDVFGSYALEDLGLTVGAEYASRTARLYDFSTDTWTYIVDETGSAYLLKASFTGVEGLTVNGSYEAKDKNYGPTTTDDPDVDTDAKEIFTASELMDASKIAADATYQLTEELSVNGAVTYCSLAKNDDIFFPGGTATTIKAGASFKVMENLVLSGSYQTTTLKFEDDPTEYGVSVMDLKAEYTLAPGVVGSFEYKTYDIKNDWYASGTDSYTAKITATF